MQRQPHHRFNVYSELYPASSIAIIGSGIITATMGELPLGAAFIASGIAVGIAGPVVRAVRERKSAKQRWIDES